MIFLSNKYKQEKTYIKEGLQLTANIRMFLIRFILKFKTNISNPYYINPDEAYNQIAARNFFKTP
jgi:hypothetical protein